MSEMNKENSEKSFEQVWQEAFEGAELTPSRDLWGDIDFELSQSLPQKKGGGKGRYFLFSAIGSMLIGGMSVQKQMPTISSNKQEKTIITSNKTKSHEVKLYYTMPALRVKSTDSNLPTQNADKVQLNLPTQNAGEVQFNLPTQNTGKVQLNLPTQNAGEVQLNLPTQDTKQTAGKIAPPLDISQNSIKKGSIIKELGKRIMQKIRNVKDSLKINTLKPLPLLAMQIPESAIQNNKKTIDFVAYPEPNNQNHVNRFWIALQRGVTLASPKLAILYDAYLQDYAQVHQLGEGIDLSNFFTEVTEKAQYSLANQADVRFGYQINPKWQVSAGIQYRAEFVEQSTNAFFVNYYDYSRHSFLLDILEGNIGTPTFSQALKHHPSYQPTADNVFSISQFNQQGLIHIASRFEYVGVPMQVGYTINPFRKVAFTLLGAAQVDKLIRSSTSSYELQDDVAIAYRLETATKISTWSWQLGAGAQAEYRYSPRWALTANSIYFENIKPIKETKYVMVRPRGLQLNVGAKYMF